MFQNIRSLCYKFSVSSKCGLSFFLQTCLDYHSGQKILVPWEIRSARIHRSFYNSTFVATSASRDEFSFSPSRCWIKRSDDSKEYCLESPLPINVQPTLIGIFILKGPTQLHSYIRNIENPFRHILYLHISLILFIDKLLTSQ